MSSAWRLFITYFWLSSIVRALNARFKHGIFMDFSLDRQWLGLYSTVAGMYLNSVREEYRRRTWIVIYYMV
jgi:hypothetical protein